MATTTDACPVRENITDLVVLDNDELSYLARGLLLHLSSSYLPGTQISTSRLVRPREGITLIRAACVELASHGYLRRGRGTAWVFQGDPTRQLV